MARWTSFCPHVLLPTGDLNTEHSSPASPAPEEVNGQPESQEPERNRPSQYLCSGDGDRLPVETCPDYGPR